MLAYLLAVLAACSNATSSVLQRKANREVPRKQNLSPRLIWSLAHQPTWFGGVLAITVGFLLQAAALGNTWLIAIGANLAVAGALVACGRRWNVSRGRKDTPGGARRAAVLGVAAGSMFGLTAALMKGMTGTFAGGISGVVTHWEIYAMIATGLLGMFLLQSALNAGQLIAAQPGLTLTDPIVSILWGVLVFGERVRAGWFVALAVASMLVLAAAVVALARSQMLSGESGQAEEGQPSGSAKPIPAQPSRNP